MDILIIAVVGLIVGLACGYLYKAKKRGKTCVGCPYSCGCASQGKGCGK